jgi:hypothetical protein
MKSTIGSQTMQKAFRQNWLTALAGMLQKILGHEPLEVLASSD